MEITTKRLILNPISKTIPERFLMDNGAIETVILLEGFTEIKRQAFYLCKNLKTIYLPESLETIGEFAFAWCKSLTKIELPNSVQTNEYKSFAWCENLKEIRIDNTEEFVDQNWDRNWKSSCDAEIIYLR
jgi:hypothetical protein